MRITLGRLRQLIKEALEENGTTNAVATYPKVAEQEDTLEEDDGGGVAVVSGGGDSGWGWGGMGFGGGGGGGSHDFGWSVDDPNNRDLLDILFP